MSMNRTLPKEVKSKKEKVPLVEKRILVALLLFTFALTAGCRYDMQDQPRYKAYNKSDFFGDKKAMRDSPEGTVARGQLREDTEFYTGKKKDADLNIQVDTTIDASGNTLVSSFPNDIDEFPLPVTKELVDRGEQRFKIFCIVCHGPVGNGDGMVVRRGFPKPPTYHDDRLRNAPVGHFFDVMTNGWGKMNSYASLVPPADRWAIAAYIRALQISQNPSGNAAPSESGASGAAENKTSEEGSNTNEPKKSGNGGERQ